jgi:endonuclease YncB( thermonuclease family)
MPLKRLAELLFLALAGASAAAAETIDARVTHIGDGDSLSVCVGGKEARVRLLGIDAPEYRQAFGKQARQSLAQLCEGQVARLAWEGADRYGRMLARVSCRQVEVNAEQVRRGMAWVSDLDAPDETLNAAQQAARDARRGLWSDPDALPPWKWRRADRAERKPQRNAAWPRAEGRECSPQN